MLSPVRVVRGINPVLRGGGVGVGNKAQREKARFPMECSETPAKWQTRSKA